MSIMDVPELSFSMLCGTNEDWMDSLGAYLDSNGNPLALSSYTLSFMMRATPEAHEAVVIASTASSVYGSPTNGNLVVGGTGSNIPGLSIPRATMLKVPPGIYVAELQAAGSGVVRTIGSYAVTVRQGLVR